MNTRFWIFSFIGLALFALTHVWPKRVEARTVTISVPEMATERDVRIITNAALEEVAGQLPQHINASKMDFANQRVVYQAGAELRDPALLGRILSCLAEVGYEAKIEQVVFDPPPMGIDRHGREYTQWADRHSVFLRVPGLKSTLDANRIVAALTLARIGDLPQFIAPDARSRSITVQYNASSFGAENLRQAIVGSGYSADDKAAHKKPADVPPQGWRHLEAGDV